ncbi:hypothetical protein [Cylindrospermum sp. FACHB-282]|uniref:hypothetical protein n=1 Tax=Cylindrospermum sp. FACHB-282 TaxID=2692794 RepID=UPI0016833C53|nr:hypothetical protein [Cylindrospermum sp. FACHB-282]MBD2388028.1 hypothetical protein [Cylindrospermum sp. FACHB-282]
MKCINCGTDNNLQERTANQGRCKRCQHSFVFEPTAMGNIKITDPMFAKVIADISAKNTLFFTSKQLLYLLDIRVKAKSFSLVGFGCLYLFSNFWVTLFSGGILNSIISANLLLITNLAYNLLLITNLAYQACVIIYLYNQIKSTKLNYPSRQKSAQALRGIGILILVIGTFTTLFVLSSFSGFTIVVILGMLSLFLGTRQISKNQSTQDFLISQSQFQEWLNKWQQINGVPAKILPSPREEVAPATINSDVTAYSFDRLVVCNSSTIAQLLIANNFHFENNCAILSITGYPQSIFATTMEMLRRNPDLQVYALHDCTPRGINLVNHLRSSDAWFLNSNVAIIDVGLLPRQIIATQQGMFIQDSPASAQEAKKLAVDVRLTLTTEELAWLDSGKFVELESFTPQRLIQILQRGIAGSRNLEADDSSLIIIGDSGSDIYAVESFG